MFYAVVRKVRIVFAYKLQNRLLPMISENGRGTQWAVASTRFAHAGDSHLANTMSIDPLLQMVYMTMLQKSPLIMCGLWLH